MFVHPQIYQVYVNVNLFYLSKMALAWHAVLTSRIKGLIIQELIHLEFRMVSQRHGNI